MIDWNSLKSWFKEHARDLPWRQERTAYRVWVSEVMLQQTQVAVVIPYFEEWMRRFPTIESLAQASKEEVIKAWEGLGYYSRARYLHEGAKQVVKEYQGSLPKDPKLLMSIKGLGAYTVGAICSFAFQQKLSAVDGNVLRVLSRLLASEADISKPKTVMQWRQQLQELLPDQEPWVINEALIELGATICRKQKPECLRCPLRNQCLAYRQGRVQELPIKSSKVAVERLYRMVFCLISNQGQVLLRHVQPGELMADLYEFPFFEGSSSAPSERELILHMEREWKIRAEQLQLLQAIEQSFTRYRVKLWPCVAFIDPISAPRNLQWISLKGLKNLPFSAGHRKIAEQLKQLKFSFSD